MERYLQIEDLSVGYDGNALIHDINLQLDKGRILTLIGPNGAGKSTILKTLVRHLPAIGGKVYIDNQSIFARSAKQMARQMAVMLTDRVRLELITCAEVVAMGRYPYTNLLGKLTVEDIAAVEDALEQVHGIELADRDFSTLSDGQRQRIMLARAICQEPEIIILDEPTAYLDIRHKIEILEILRNMAQKKQITVVMSLHEIDLAMKVSDYLLCVKGDTITAFGSPEQILQKYSIEELFNLDNGSYNPLFGSVELSKTGGPPQLFVVAGGGFGAPFYRELQKRRMPFATGILFENDVDYQIAKTLSDHVVAAPAFTPMGEEEYDRAARLLLQCSAVLDAGTPLGTLNETNGRLLALATERHIPISKQLP
ncbi:MAG: ABC transporter ATP-binding protein [Firmicutes bacterium]|nr:ABC transporter ATP-binding protein [Bacillota bacterium]